MRRDRLIHTLSLALVILVFGAQAVTRLRGW